MTGQILWKIVSGGQDGAELAALDAARGKWLRWGGFCPKNKLFGSGEPIPSKYIKGHELFDGEFYDGLVQSDSNSYREWAINNPKNSDGTLILCPKVQMTMGSEIHAFYCSKNYKPFISVDPWEKYRSRKTAKWIIENNIRVLNVTGPTPGKFKDIYKESLSFMNEMLSAVFIIEQYGIDLYDKLNVITRK